jgi:hypothetical protein
VGEIKKVSACADENFVDEETSTLYVNYTLINTHTTQHYTTPHTHYTTHLWSGRLRRTSAALRECCRNSLLYLSAVPVFAAAVCMCVCACVYVCVCKHIYPTRISYYYPYYTLPTTHTTHYPHYPPISRSSSWSSSLLSEEPPAKTGEPVYVMKCGYSYVCARWYMCNTYGVVCVSTACASDTRIAHTHTHTHTYTHTHTHTLVHT